MEPKFQKEKHTLLMPGLFPIHMEFLAAAIRASGYRVKVLSSSGRSVLDLALGSIHNDMCYPAMCSVGQQLHAVTSGAFDPDGVGIVGEVYVKYSPFANNNLEEFLQSQDCEYMLPGVLGFIHYCLTGPAVDWELYGGSRLRHWISLALGRIVQRYETALAKALAPFPQFHQPPSFHAMEEMGARVLSRGVKMGEGWYLPAEMVELIESDYNNILCVQPFGCLPNHIVGRGTLRKLRELYPRANIMPLDYDPGLSQVNQENRIKLLLANAGLSRA